ncbi:MAG: autotransporter assembly complex family protein [Pseudomonadota bacterium]
MLTQTPVLGATVSVELVGIGGKLRSNVEAYLGILRQSRTDGGRQTSLSETDLRRLHRNARDEIHKALQPFGYYDSQIAATLQRAQTGDGVTQDSVDETRVGHWVARYEIDAGPATQLREVDVALNGSGKEEPRLTRAVADASLQEGTILLHETYEGLKTNLQNEAYNLGYLDGQFTENQIRVHEGRQQADIRLTFDTGQQFYFGDIHVEQDILADSFIENFVAIESGEPFSPRRLIDLQLALSESGFFSSAEVQVDRENAQGDRVPVQVSTVPAKARRFETSLGYGTDTGVRGRVGALWRRINRNGHRMQTDLRLSQIQQSLVARYTVPIGDMRSEYIDYGAELDRRDLNDVESTRYSFGSSINRNRWGGRRRLGLRYQYETWNFGDNPQQQSGLLIPYLEYDRVVADDLLFTREGYSASLILSGAAVGVASDTSFAQLYLAARAVRPLGERSRLLLRAEYGATQAGDFDLIPPSLRFFNGGAQSVRGYGFEDLSPLDEQGNRVGGEFLGTISAEADYLFYGNFGIAAFVDAGNASDEPGINLKRGAGVGLRYKTPIGMVRIDFAHPFDDPDSSFAFHISLGPDLQ